MKTGSQMEDLMTKRKYDIGFFSSADRGLDTLLKILPDVEKKLGRPVTSVWAYGWDMYDMMHKKDQTKMKWRWQVTRDMNKVGMESKGRLSHTDLAKFMKDVEVWAYPTDFTEIHCITALKVQAAGCKPVTSGLAALKETVLKPEEEIEAISTKPKELEAYVDRLVTALQRPRDEMLIKLTSKWAKEHSWESVAKAWDKELR